MSLTDTSDCITFEPQCATTSHKRSLSLRVLGGLLREFRLLWHTIGAHNISTVISFLKL